MDKIDAEILTKKFNELFIKIINLENQIKELQKEKELKEEEKSENRMQDFAKDSKEEEEKSKFNEAWSPKVGEEFYFMAIALSDIDSFFLQKKNEDKFYQNFSFKFVQIAKENGNIFQTREQAKQRAKEIKLYNLLKNFSDANGGGGDWIIAYDTLTKEYKAEFKLSSCEFVGCIQFSCREVAEEALLRYKTELEELVK